MNSLLLVILGYTLFLFYGLLNLRSCSGFPISALSSLIVWSIIIECETKDYYLYLLSLVYLPQILYYVQYVYVSIGDFKSSLLKIKLVDSKCIILLQSEIGTLYLELYKIFTNYISACLINQSVKDYLKRAVLCIFTSVLDSDGLFSWLFITNITF